jgi:hypothetical protein
LRTCIRRSKSAAWHARRTCCDGIHPALVRRRAEAILLGLFTSPIAFLCAGQMAFAYFINHNPRGFFPIQNGGERAALFCYFFLFVWVAGAGRWSADGLRRKT